MIKRMIVAIDEEKATAQAPHKDVPIQCVKCGSGADDRYLLPACHKSKSRWICTQCHPSLIHG